MLSVSMLTVWMASIRAALAMPSPFTRALRPSFIARRRPFGAVARIVGSRRIVFLAIEQLVAESNGRCALVLAFERASEWT